MSATPMVKCLWNFSVVVIKTFLTTTALLLFFHCKLSAQEYSYVHYDVKDGLAASRVYDLTQDPDGFIWFATEAGVSRFDGTHFKNFSTADGLPETDIIKIFADTKGRIWMAPFKNTLCYYYKGKIYNNENDSFLAKIKPPTPFRDLHEDRNGNIFLLTMEREIITLHMDSASPRVEKYRHPYQHGDGIFEILNNPSGKGIIFRTRKCIYSLIDGKSEIWASYKNFDGVQPLMIYPNKTIRPIENFPETPNPIHYIAGDSNLYYHSLNGAWLLDTLQWRFNKVFLPGKHITRVLIDKEKNTWFTTHGGGVYKMISDEFRTWKLTSRSNTELLTLEKAGQTLFIGATFGKVFTLTAGKWDSINTTSLGYTDPNRTNRNRLLTVFPEDKENILFGFEDGLIRYKSNKQMQVYTGNLRGIRSMDRVDSNTLLVGSMMVGGLLRTDSLASTSIENVWLRRASAVAFYNNEYYLGTPEGLIIVTRNKIGRSPGNTFRPLKQRVGGLAKDRFGNLWVTTYGGGLIQMKGDKPIRHFTTKNGLTSDICRVLYLQDKYLWVGTDKGINKIDISNPSYPIVHYSTDDGLPDNIINEIYAENDSVYVITSAGLTIFDESKLSSYSICKLKLLETSVGGRSRPLDSLQYLKSTENSIRFNFVAISFRSGGEILYRYRLKGLTNDWDSTRQTMLEFLSLPSGSYELELIAVNKFGLASNSATIPFTIATPFWQTLWFKLFVITAIVSLTWWLVNRRFVAIRKREQEKISLQSRLSDLEQLALRAQMNPHFIFNCLNSIQNFIIHNDLETTNQYLTEFAHLIRQTLDNAAKSTLSIDNEVQYLTRYLDMEQMRFGNSFDYSITVDPLIEREHTFIPTMILQPYVENSIRHGVRYKQNGKGLIEIMFEKNENELLCIVQDNGIGREKAAALKSQMHMEYQSKGMKLTEERIKALNRTLPSPVTITVIDSKGADGGPAGTRIEIHFPTEILI